MGRKVYADNAATTAVSPQVLEAMLPFYKEVYGNPSSLYGLGQEAKAKLEQARETVAKCLGAKPNEIFFTSCGTESDNWAIKGCAKAQLKKHGKNHIITSAFEHHAVLHTCQATPITKSAPSSPSRKSGRSARSMGCPSTQTRCRLWATSTST